MKLEDSFAMDSKWDIDKNVVHEEWFEEGGVYAGCVFLPCAGYRGGSSSGASGAAVKGIGTHGYYWSSTPSGSNAWIMYFYSGDVGTGSNHCRNDARCMRPVRVSEN